LDLSANRLDPGVLGCAVTTDTKAAADEEVVGVGVVVLLDASYLGLELALAAVFMISG
jgi:hypothetical protein